MLIFIECALDQVSNEVLLRLCNSFYDPSACPKYVSLHFRCALGLEKGSHKTIRVVFDTTLRVCGTTVRVLMPLLFLAHCAKFGLGLGLGNMIITARA